MPVGSVGMSALALAGASAGLSVGPLAGSADAEVADPGVAERVRSRFCSGWSIGLENLRTNIMIPLYSVKPNSLSPLYDAFSHGH